MSFYQGETAPDHITKFEQCDENLLEAYDDYQKTSFDSLPVREKFSYCLMYFEPSRKMVETYNTEEDRIEMVWVDGFERNGVFSFHGMDGPIFFKEEYSRGGTTFSILPTKKQVLWNN